MVGLFFVQTALTPDGTICQRQNILQIQTSEVYKTSEVSRFNLSNPTPQKKEAILLR